MQVITIVGGQKIATEENGMLESLNVAIFLFNIIVAKPFKKLFRKFPVRYAISHVSFTRGG